MPKRTVLYDWHRKRNARIVDFAGWEMPVQYSGIVEEHQAVRRNAGLFDVSHMGQIFVEGKQALAFLQRIGTNDFARLSPGRAMYSHLCNERGGVVDDIFVYCLIPERYLIVVNASTTEKDFGWMRSHALPESRLRNESAGLGMIAVQGPRAAEILKQIFPNLPDRLQVREDLFSGHPVYVCRTGYTGEDGFELIAPNEGLPALADRVWEAGRPSGLLPCGLGARDTLRLESGFLLYGNDVDEEHSPLEAGVAWVVKFDKGDFIGKPALWAQKNGGLKRKLLGFRLTERGIPRHGSRIFSEGREIGTVTSGTFSPSLQVGIAVGYVPTGPLRRVEIECHGRKVSAEIATLPFYKKA